MKPQGIAVLGATGSIGVNTLDVVARHPDRYRVVALSGHRQVDRLFEQACRFLPLYVVVADAAAANALQGRLREQGLSTEVLHGAAALERVIADDRVAAEWGRAGLERARAFTWTGSAATLRRAYTDAIARRRDRQ